MSATTFRLGACEVDLIAREVRLAGQLSPVEPRAFEVLAYLIRQRHRVVHKKELLDAVWPGVAVTEGAVARAVMKARHAIGDGGEPPMIRTVQRVGYRFVAPVDGDPQHSMPAPLDLLAPAPDAPAPAAPGPLTIALLPFDNCTGEPALQWVELGLMSLVAHALQQDARFSPVGVASLLSALDSARDAGAAELEARVRHATGAQAVVHTRVERAATAYRLQCSTTQAGRPCQLELRAAAPAELAAQMAGALVNLFFPGTAAAGSAYVASGDRLAAEAFARALQAVAAQKWPQAVNLYRMALELAPGSVAMQLELLRALAVVGDSHEAERLARKLIAHAERTGDLLLAGRVNLALARLHYNRNAVSAAAFRLQAGLRLGNGELTLDEQAVGLLMQASIASSQHDFVAMGPALDRLEALCERSGNRSLPVAGRMLRALAAAADDDHEQAVRLSCAAAGQARELRTQSYLSTCCTNAAASLAELCRFGEAAVQAEEALATALALRDWPLAADAVADACWIYRLARTPAASQRILASLQALEPPPDGEPPLVWRGRGHHAAAEGDHAAAAQCFRQAVLRLRRDHDRLNEQQTMPWLVCALVQSGQIEEALSELGLALQRPYLQNQRLQKQMLHCRALLAHAQDRPDEALALLQQLIARQPTPLWQAWACLDAAWLHAQAGRVREARQLLHQVPQGYATQPAALAVAARVQQGTGGMAQSRTLPSRQ